MIAKCTFENKDAAYFIGSTEELIQFYAEKHFSTLGRVIYVNRCLTSEVSLLKNFEHARRQFDYYKKKKVFWIDTKRSPTNTTAIRFS